MGTANQFWYLHEHVGRKVRGPILEVGSKDYGNTVPFRKYYEGYDYTGLDLSPGKNVDVVCDLGKGTGDLPREHYDLIICCSVLEHCEDPFTVARNLTSLLRPSGMIYCATPWVQRYHAYPDDYWRFTQSGIRKLFPGVTFIAPRLSTWAEHQFIDIEADPAADNKYSMTHDGHKYMPYLELHMLGMKNGSGHV